MRWVFFSLFSLSLLSFCGVNYRFIDEELREKGDFLYVRNFSHQFFDSEMGGEWVMEAKEAFFPSQAGNPFGFSSPNEGEPVIIYDFFFRHYKEGKKLDFSLQGGRAEIDKEKLSLKKNISFKEEASGGSKGREVSGEEMYYNFASQLLQSNRSARLKQEGLYSVCRGGIKIDLLRKKQYCASPEFRQRGFSLP